MTGIVPLSPDEQERLDDCEKRIAKGLIYFVDVGTALCEVRDSRLYRETDGSFESYCQRRWNFGGKRGYQLIGAAQVARNLSTIVDSVDDALPLPVADSHLRPLVALDPLQQQLVWMVVSKTAPDGEVTQRHVQSVVNATRDLLVTRGVDDGDGGQIAISDIFTAAVTDETIERIKRNTQHLRDNKSRKALRRQIGERMRIDQLLAVKVKLIDRDALAQVPAESMRYYVEMSRRWSLMLERDDALHYESVSDFSADVIVIPRRNFAGGDYEIYAGKVIEGIAAIENRSELAVYADLMALTVPDDYLQALAVDELMALPIQ